MRHRDLGGALDGVDDTGIAPTVQNQSPQMQHMIQQYSLMAPEKLEELAVRYRGTPYAPIIQKVLSQKQLQPSSQPTLQPAAPQEFQDGGLVQMRPIGGAVTTPASDGTYTPASASAAELTAGPHSATGRDLVNAGLNVGSMLFPPLGVLNAANNAERGAESGFNRAAYGDSAPENPTLGGSKFLGNMLYGKGMVGTVADPLGWMAGKFSNAMGWTPGTDTVPPNFSGPPNPVSPQNMGIDLTRDGAQPNSTGQMNYSIEAPQQVQLRNEPGAPTGIAIAQPTFDLPTQDAQPQTVMARDPETGQFIGKIDPGPITLPDAAPETASGGAGQSQPDPASQPWQGQGSMADLTGAPWYSDTRDMSFPNFMAGAGFGGAGYGYGGGGGGGGGGAGGSGGGGGIGGGSGSGGGWGGGDVSHLQSDNNGGWGQARGGKVQRRDSGGGIAAYDDGGGVSLSEGSPWWTRQAAGSLNRGSGFLKGDTLGRADSVKTTAPSGSYIIPSDVIAGIGEGNSIAGARVIEEMLSSGPWGTPKQRITASNRAPHPTAKVPENDVMLAKGGTAEADAGHHTPVLLSHGEYSIDVPDVVRIGRGSLKRGHRVLDAFVLHRRQKDIAKLKSLAPPVGAKKS